MHPFVLAASAGLFFMAALIFVLLFWSERIKRKDTEFIAGEAVIALRNLLLRCPTCKGSGRMAIPGGTIGCRVCGEAHHTLGNLCALVASMDDRASITNFHR